MKNVLLSNFFWLALEKIIRLFGGLLVTVLLARYLGPESYGVLNYAISFVFFFTIFARLGLDQIVVRELKREEFSHGSLLGTSIVMKLVGATIALLLIAIVTGQIEISDEKQILIFIIASSMIFKSLDVIEFYLQSLFLSRFIMFARSLAFVITSLAKLYFIYTEQSLYFFAMLILIEAVLAAFFFVVIFFTKIQTVNLSKIRVSKGVVYKLLRDGWPIAVAGFLVSIHLKVDQMMIAHLLDDTNLGIYSIAVTISEAWYFLPMIVVNVLFPYLVELKKSNQLLYEARLLQLYSFMFWLGAILAIIVYFFGQIFIEILFGTAFEYAYKPLLINIWAGVFVAQSFSKTIWDVAENLQLYRIVSNMFSLVINIFGNLLLIPIFGVVGAAISTLITRVMNNWIIPLFIPAYRENTIKSIISINPKYLCGFHIERKN
jgi:O-antigen/teichoic acid export membrane protein